MGEKSEIDKGLRYISKEFYALLTAFSFITTPSMCKNTEGVFFLQVCSTRKKVNVDKIGK